MTAYKNPVITLRFDDLADGMHVVIRNPRIMPASELRAIAAGRTDEDRAKFEAARAAIEAGGTPDEEVLTEDDQDRIFAMFAKLIIGWRVPDPRVVPEIDDDGNVIEGGTEPPRLPVPATPELVGLLPGSVLTRIMEEFKGANPQMPTASPEDGTSRTS